jgi:hypothetical protein
MRNTADVTTGKHIVVWLQSITIVNAINRLLRYSWKREVLFFYLSRTAYKTWTWLLISMYCNPLSGIYNTRLASVYSALDNRECHHQPTTVHCWTEASPISCHLARSSATRIQLMPSVLSKSSLHLAWGRPTLRLPRRGLHTRTCLPLRLSVLRLIWPAHCHFSMLIRVSIIFIYYYLY